MGEDLSFFLIIIDKDSRATFQIWAKVEVWNPPTQFCRRLKCLKILTSRD